MQISPISAFKATFKGNSMPIPEGAVLRYDEGQPYVAFPVGMRKDSFERQASRPASEFECSTMQEAIERRVPGYRHEDFLY